MIEKIAAGFGEQKEEVVIEKKSPEIRTPEKITRLGKSKLEFLANLAEIKPDDVVLELFGGSNLSSAVFAAKKPKAFVSVDLRYAPSKGTSWHYKPNLNFGEMGIALKSGKTTAPSFVAADAAELPFSDESFSLVLAPDSPRTAAERLTEGEEAQRYTAGTESELSAEEQKKLFYKASSEALRVLMVRGRYAGTAPIDWARELKKIAFSNVVLIGDKNIGVDVQETKEFSRNRKVQFKIKSMKNPIVYFRCEKQ